jgi:hypothetical protein
MHDLPSVPALLALARNVLVGELTPLLPEDRRNDALLVAECIAIAERAGEAGSEPMWAMLHELELFYEGSGPVPPPPQPSPDCGGGKTSQPSPACGGGKTSQPSPACGGGKGGGG